MTSRVSFFKLCLENMKRRIWLLVLTILTYFVCGPLGMMIAVQNEEARVMRGGRADYAEIFSSVLGMGYQSVLAAGLAIICAVAGFGWLFSKKKVDMYHSMPVKREKLFAVMYLNGIVIWLVPYAISTLICLVMISGYVTLTGSVLVTAMITVGINVLFFLFFYHLSLVAVMLTGNMINCMLTGGVLFLYATALGGLLEVYLECFMATYYSSFEIAQLRFTSPILALVYLADEFTKWENGFLVYITGGAFAFYSLQCMVLTVIAGVTAVLLYKKRPSETAGKSIAFAKILNIYRILLVIPLSLASGVFFALLVDSNSYAIGTAWFIFGLLFGLVLSHGFIEVLFQMDIKAMFSYKKQLIATGVVVFIVAFSFKEDWYGIDSYLPEEEKIESMAITAGTLEGWRIYYNDFVADEYKSGEDYILENMTLTEIEAAYELSKLGMEYVNEQRDNDYSGKYDEYIIYYTVKYRLKNGKEELRRYWLPLETAYPYIEELYTMQEYKEGSMKLFWEHAQEATIVSLNNVEHNNQELSGPIVQEFLEIYKKEYESLTADEVLKSAMVGEISYEIRDETGLSWIARAGDAPIYESCVETVQFLEEHGIDVSGLKTTYDPEKVREIVIRLNMTGDEKIEALMEKYGITGYGDKLIITDKQEIQKLLPYLVRDLSPYEGYKEYDENYDIYVTWTDLQNEGSGYARLKPGAPIMDLEMKVQLD